MTILTLSKITKTYRKGDIEVKALGGIDLDLEKGEFCAIVGPSGSGKTTLLNIIGCLDKPTSGLISYQGRELKVLGEKELSAYRREHVSFIFQSFNLIPVLTVAENVELPLSIDGSFSKAAMRKKAMEMLKAVGIADKADRYPRELSGGQEQRVAIARALIKDPSVVLADEPTANLDSRNAEEIIRLMKLMNQKSQTTFIFSTHDKMIMEEAQRVFHLHDGLIVNDERKEK
ncbi:MAG: ABC transporter ATP-binding protein [Spirochaetia bacterium]|jgi:putative ABC transport system ATP-binding protein|nr:ABC transporter ATP-binding protein [Spirochaetales bacterium]MDX9783271.1 ABC transporter ATP-binding protein [Spirochaetia bacterium]